MGHFVGIIDILFLDFLVHLCSRKGLRTKYNGKNEQEVFRYYYDVGCCPYWLQRQERSKRMEPIKVMVETVKEAPVYGGQSYSGTIEEQSGSTLSFTCGGTINNIAVAEGQMVGKGQLIATVDPTSVRNAYDASLATRQQAEDAYRRMEAVARQWQYA